jgi:hypothetical protein
MRQKYSPKLQNTWTDLTWKRWTTVTSEWHSQRKVSCSRKHRDLSAGFVRHSDTNAARKSQDDINTSIKKKITFYVMDIRAR